MNRLASDCGHQSIKGRFRFLVRRMWKKKGESIETRTLRSHAYGDQTPPLCCMHPRARPSIPHVRLDAQGCRRVEEEGAVPVRLRSHEAASGACIPLASILAGDSQGSRFVQTLFSETTREFSEADRRLIAEVLHRPAPNEAEVTKMVAALCVFPSTRCSLLLAVDSKTPQQTDMARPHV